MIKNALVMNFFCCFQLHIVRKIRKNSFTEIKLNLNELNSMQFCIFNNYPQELNNINEIF